MEYEILRFGNEGHPVVVIDDFHPDPDALRDRAICLSYTAPNYAYPGLRAPFDPNYMAPAMAGLQQVLAGVFGLSKGVVLRECCASIVTTLPQDLSESQSIPHSDGSDPKQMALLHYIDSPDKGGTAFYRHIETGFESVTPDREVAYDAALNRQRDKGELPTGAYKTQSCRAFEKIGGVDGKYNRMVIYHGNGLHSGQINPDNDFCDDPSRARLTINTFLLGR